MNRSSDSEPLSPPQSAESARREAEAPLPTNLREALLSLIASRAALIELESKDAAANGARRAMLMAAAGICVFFTWSLLLAGGIAAISDAAGWPWQWVAMAAAVLHLAIAIVLARTAKSSGQPSFPFTRAEFQKDREWIENFHKTRKSSD